MDRVLHYFQEISRIPRGSGNCRGIADYILAFAKEQGLFAYTDEAMNVVIEKDAAEGYEQAPRVILQGHMDMVCEKDADSTHDFLSDPLTLVTEGDWLRADGTTLGGDDGIAVAYMLAILENKDLPAPALTCVFTTDEEVGMLGAIALDYSAVKGQYMLNLDSEDEGIFLAGCAGGLSLHVSLPVAKADKKAFWTRIRIEGLLGGHSGMEIIKRRCNAAILSGRLLRELDDQFELSLASLSSGNKDNAIPLAADLLVGLNEEETESLPAFLADFAARAAEEYRGIEEEVRVFCAETREGTECALLPADKDRVIRYLTGIPDGVFEMSDTIADLVETSCNLGILRLEEDRLFALTSVRSTFEEKKKELADRITSRAEELGGSVVTEGEYPAWEYLPESPWRDFCLRAYREQTGEEPTVQVIHAGLECGLFYRGIPNLECVAIGPNMKDIHTSRERLSLSSSERVYRYVLALLQKIKEI